MNVTLPPPLDIYVSAEASTDVERLADCFASNAMVRDEGRTITGWDAIKAWKKDTKARYQYTLQPLDVIQNKSAVKMRARLTGKCVVCGVAAADARSVRRTRQASLHQEV
jgi:hypothetical protein